MSSLATLKVRRAGWRKLEIDRHTHYARGDQAARKKWGPLYRQARDRRRALDAAIKAARVAGVSSAGTHLVATFEGYRGCPYRDAVGVWTIGYGHTNGVGPNTRCLTMTQAVALLNKDLDAFAQGVRRLLRRKPTQSQLDAMVSLAYNVGIGAFAGSTVLRQFNAGHDAAAADAFLAWDKAGGRVLSGLLRRRRAERALYLK